MLSGIARNPRTLGDLTAHWAARAPEREALALGDRRWTWQQLHLRSRRLAGWLRTAGVGPGDRIAFLDRNHPACFEATFAAGAIGAANAVLNWRLAAAELAYVIEDSGARVLFVGAGLLATVRPVLTGIPAVERVVVVGGEADEYEQVIAGSPPAEDTTAAAPDDTCLILYTSGTTGFPKGAKLTHEGLLRHGSAMCDTFAFGDGARNLVVLPLFHVGGIAFALGSLLTGTPTALLREPTPQALCEAIADGATHALLVPAMVAGIVRSDTAVTEAFARLRHCLYGASPMPLPILRTALELFPRVKFTQLYGMTELSGAVTALPPEAHHDHRRPDRLTSAGRPLPGVEVRVVGPDTGTDVPAGAAGELWVRTRQRMKGYLGKPEATAQAIAEGGWLRTGDVARIDDGGYVFIEDRLKDVIITGGENVYSAEVERVLVEHPAVAEAAVIAVPDETWGEAVAAVLTQADGARIDEAELRSFCRERLAGFKCPRTITVLDALPRNATGKVSKDTLRAAHRPGPPGGRAAMGGPWRP